MENFTTRFWARVNKTETCWEWTGSLITGGYGRITYGGKQSVAHRVSYEMSGEVIPAGMDIDHICHNRACVRPEHLRLATRKQNSENVTGAYKNSQTGIRGVTKRGNSWRAQVRHNGKLITVGTFTNSADAEAAVIALRAELFTHSDMDRAA